MFGLCLGAFVSLYMVIDILEKTARFLKFQPEIAHLATYFACKVPGIISEVLPLAVLMATLLSLNMLSRTSELVAMRSLGASLAFISAPVLVAALLTSLAGVIFGELVAPSAFRKMMFTEEVLIKKKGYAASFRQNNIWFRDENLIMRARAFDPNKQALKGLTLWQVGPAMEPSRRIEAEQAVWSGNQWRFQGVIIRDMVGGDVIRTEKAQQTPVQLNLKTDDLKIVHKSADNMGFIQLWNYIDKLKKGGYDTTRYKTLLHDRIAYPFASLVMAFIGIPFSLRGSRSRGVALGIGASIAIGFTYFIIHSVLISFGQTGVIPPFAAAWSGNLIFCLVGIWLALTMDH